jgi:hypothetical protein
MTPPEISLSKRKVLAASGGITIALSFIFISPWWLGFTLPFVAMVLLLMSVNWKTPLTSTVVAAASFFLMGLAIASVPVAADKAPVVGLLVLTVWLLSFVVAPVVWAVTGYTFKTTPRRRWVIASVTAFTVCAVTLVAATLLTAFMR